MITQIALPAAVTPTSASAEIPGNGDFVAVISIDEARAGQVLEYVTHMKYVRRNWPEAWAIYSFDDEGPLYVPAAEVPAFGASSYLVLPDFVPSAVLDISGTCMVTSSEGISWESTDAANAFRLNTKEIDDRLLRLLASGMPLGEGAERSTINLDLTAAFLLDQRLSLQSH